MLTKVKVQKCKKLRGGMLLDVMVGIFFLLMSSLTFAALFPTVKRAEAMSKNESKAVQMTGRLIEHIQMLPAKDINAESLTALNLIDTGQLGQAQPWSFTHIPLDEASMYSPAQVLRDADGQITTTTLAGGSVKVLITLTYTSESGKTKTIKTGTVVGSFR